ncbi:MAG: disulfide bond formation protein B [Roseiflexaceae bacterium]|nr:disulfide bond formation protein B [Roseiflexaceae bacterium]
MAQHISNPDVRVQPQQDAAQPITLQAAPYLALSAAWVATCGSLFMSEVLGWTPCLLCWYQRILMYPLSLIITIGLLRRDRALPVYVLPLSLFGAGIAIYHYLLQKTTWLPPPACSTTVPCTADYINLLGFITVPFLALTAFLVISLAMVAMLWSRGNTAQTSDDAPSVGYDTVAIIGIAGAIVVSFVVAARLV